MATDLCEGAFHPNCAEKRLKMTKVLMPLKVLESMVKSRFFVSCTFQKCNLY